MGMFIKKFASEMAPIIDLTATKNKPKRLVWTKKSDEAFRKIKTMLSSTPQEGDSPEEQKTICFYSHKISPCH
jgi:LPS O-antigen subunit length determinant protein (WzzB/FepE family)